MESQPQKNQKPYERTTITVPADLKNRMKAMGRDINWSSVACVAFENKIEKIEAAERKQFEHAIIRLRAEKSQQAICHEHENGLLKGRQWAIEIASIESLQRLRKFRDSLTGDKWESHFSDVQRIVELAIMLGDQTARKSDDLYDDGVEIAMKHKKGSVSLLQRELAIGYGRASRLLEMMEQDGIVESSCGGKSRKVSDDAKLRVKLKIWGAILEEKAPVSPEFYKGFVVGALDVWGTVREAI